MRTREIEMMRGTNLQMVRQILGRVHCGVSCLAAVRAVFAELPRQSRHKAPAALRRGLVATIIREHNANRDLYNMVNG